MIGHPRKEPQPSRCRKRATVREIAAKIGQGVSPAGVLKVCKRFAETGTIKNKAGRGRKKVTTPQTDRRIVRLALRNRKSTSIDINNALADSGVAVSGRTVRRRLVSAGLRARIPRKKPFLNPAQRLKRLQWAKKHVSWTSEQWKKVLWSDETRISIFGSDGVRYVRRRPGEDCLPECTTATMKHPLSIMVWGCMSRDSVGRLQVLNGTVNADKYIQEVLEPRSCLQPETYLVTGSHLSSSRMVLHATLPRNALHGARRTRWSCWIGQVIALTSIQLRICGRD